MTARFLQSLSPGAYAELERIAKAEPLILGLSYGIIEYFLISSSPFSPIFISPAWGYVYRIVYIIVLFLPFASRNYWRWFARGALAMTVQDASYWAFDFWKTGGLPVQWAWYYPVWNSIPLLYLTLPVVFFSYWKGGHWRRTGWQVQGKPTPVKDRVAAKGQTSVST